MTWPRPATSRSPRSSTTAMPRLAAGSNATRPAAGGLRLPEPLGREQALDDAAACIGWLNAQPTVERIAMIGFSAGGHLSYLAACRLAIDRTAVLYGGWLPTTDIPMSRPSPTLELTPGIRGRMLYLVGEDDALIDAGATPPDQRRAREARASSTTWSATPAPSTRSSGPARPPSIGRPAMMPGRAFWACWRTSAQTHQAETGVLSLRPFPWRSTLASGHPDREHGSPRPLRWLIIVVTVIVALTVGWPLVSLAVSDNQPVAAGQPLTIGPGRLSFGHVHSRAGLDAPQCRDQHD